MKFKNRIVESYSEYEVSNKIKKYKPTGDLKRVDKSAIVYLATTVMDYMEVDLKKALDWLEFYLEEFLSDSGFIYGHPDWTDENELGDVLDRLVTYIETR